jgi:hypothetical protein
VLPKVGPMVLLESQLNEHRESQFHWIAGDPVGQIMVYKQQLWVAGTIADTLLQAFPSLDWTIRKEKTDTITQKDYTGSYLFIRRLRAKITGGIGAKINQKKKYLVFCFTGSY